MNVAKLFTDLKVHIVNINHAVEYFAQRICGRPLQEDRHTSPAVSGDARRIDFFLHAGKHRLDRLVVLVDYNRMQCYGTTEEVQTLEPFSAKWESFGFAVREVDGHDVNALRQVLEDMPMDETRPSAVICHTVKGKGSRAIENNASWHHKSRLTDEELEELLAGVGS